MSQIHKGFTSDEVKELLERYSKKEIERKYIQEILGIGKSRFFMLMSQYREDPQLFTIHYERNTPSRISKEIEHNIVKELSIEKGIIQNKEIPLKSYNYSFIKDRLRKKYHQKVSLTTIIRRAQKHGFYLKKPKRTLRDPGNPLSAIPKSPKRESISLQRIHNQTPLSVREGYLLPPKSDFGARVNSSMCNALKIPTSTGCTFKT